MEQSTDCGFSFSGQRNRICEVIPGVYEFMSAEMEPTYAVSKEKSKDIIPPQIYQYGFESDDPQYVLFDYDHGRFVIEYEVCLYQLQSCAKEERESLQLRLLELSVFGAEMNGDYFGEPIPQHQTPWGRLNRYVEVDTGLWLIQSCGTWALEVAFVYCGCLSDIPEKLAIGNLGVSPNFVMENMYWEMKDCAPVLFELLENKPGIADLITSETDLHRHLIVNFPEYVEQYNGEIEKAIAIFQEDDPGQMLPDSYCRLITADESASTDFLKLPIPFN